MSTVGVAWCTYFQRRGLTWYPRLRDAYRAPGLFASEYRRPGICDIQVVNVDELFRADDFDGTLDRRADGLDILYLGAHGELRGSDFKLVLHSGEWYPAQGGLDLEGPRIVVFDACNLLDRNDPDWADPWLAQTRRRLRLVLGFASLATVSKGTALRGEEFARRVARGDPVARAWLMAVRATAPARVKDIPAAIAFGADQADAVFVRDQATITDLAALPDLTAPAQVEFLT